MSEIQHKTKKTLFDQSVPNLVELQITSYDWFIKEGLKELLDSFSPIKNYDETCSVEFIGDPVFEEPETSEDECRRDLKTYEGEVKIRVRLSNKNKKDNGLDEISFVEEDVYLFSLPKMTENGTFINNGAERVVVSQLYRSPGAYFEDNFDNSGKQLYIGKILPATGAWIEMFTDNNEMRAHIAQSAKFPITVLLRSLNNIEEACPYPVDNLLGKKLEFEIKDKDGNVIFEPAKSGRSKSKKTSPKEVDIINENHIKVLKEYFGDYIFTSHYDPISTTEQVLNVFGRKEFIKISRLFQITNFVKKGDLLEKSENEVISIPAKDKNSKLNDRFRVLNTDIINRDGKVLFKKGLKFDDDKLNVRLPIKNETITVGKEKLNRYKCIEYIIKNGYNDKYKTAISADNVKSEEANLLIEWLISSSSVENNGVPEKPVYNISGLRCANDIIDEITGEVLCEATE
ncbi:MAG: hypothetical protein KBT47_07220, partial [Armatimonadetes bacterium]|nr:hypothetical protein [Candidatus Hippobium faecium]